MTDLGGLLPASEAAPEARLSRERLIRLIQSGEVVGQKVARTWMVDLTSLRAFIAREAATAK